MTTNCANVKLVRVNYHTFRHKRTKHRKIEEGIYSSWCTFSYIHKSCEFPDGSEEALEATETTSCPENCHS